MKIEAKKLIQEIHFAFKDHKRPQGEPLFVSESGEFDSASLGKILNSHNWMELSHEVVMDHSIALIFMSDDAFAYFLPAYMEVSVTLYYESDVLAGTVITCLTPPGPLPSFPADLLKTMGDLIDLPLMEEAHAMLDAGSEGQWERFNSRLQLLTSTERQAVRSFLKYMSQAHGEDFPVAGPDEALERYWGRTE